MKRFEKKLDHLFWFVVSVLPLLIFLFTTWNNPTSANFADFIAEFRFDFVADIFTQIFTDVLVFPAALIDFLSYFIAVCYIHIIVDVVVLIPRLFHKLEEVITK